MITNMIHDIIIYNHNSLYENTIYFIVTLRVYNALILIIIKYMVTYDAECIIIHLFIFY